MLRVAVHSFIGDQATSPSYASPGEIEDSSSPTYGSEQVESLEYTTDLDPESSVYDADSLQQQDEVYEGLPEGRKPLYVASVFSLCYPTSIRDEVETR